MKVSLEELPPRQAVLSIEVEPQELEGSLEKAYRRLVQRTVVPGFRKGKTPRPVLERFLGREALLSQAVDILIPEVTARAIKEQNLEAVAQPQVEIVSMEPVALKATVPLKPVVRLGEYRQIRIEEEVVEVKDEEVDAALEKLRRDLAPWEPSEAPLEDGDLLTMAVQGIVEGRRVLGHQDATYLIDSQSKTPAPGFAQALLGARGGEKRDFALTFPGDYPDPGLADKECAFSVALKEVKRKRLPELDDEFAKGVEQGYDSLGALRQKVKESLVERARRAARSKYEEKVVEQVLQEATLEYPPFLVEHEVDHMLSDRERRLNRGRMSMEEYLQATGKSAEQLREELKAEAVERLQRSLVLGQMAEEEGIQASPQDIEAELESIVSANREQGEAVRRLFQSEDGTDSLRRIILTRKTVERLVDIATGKEPSPSAESQEGKSK